MPLYDWPVTDTSAQIQGVSTAVGLLTIGSTDVAVVWPEPFTSSAIIVEATVEMGTVSIGKIVANVKGGTITTTGCTITLTNSALVSVAAGSVLHVLAFG